MASVRRLAPAMFTIFTIFIITLLTEAAVEEKTNNLKSNSMPNANDLYGLPPVFLERPEYIRRDPRKHPSNTHRPISVATSQERQGSGPLVITPLLESGNVETARELSKVGFIVDGLQDSHSGYFTVNKDFGSNIFFWLFKAKVSWIISILLR